MVRHPKRIHGLQAAAVTARDRDTRRALEAMASPGNYDPETLEFDHKGRLTVRREWVEQVVREILEAENDG